MMKFFYTGHLSRPKKSLVFFGIGLLFLSIFLTAITFLGFLQLESFAFLGHSGVRTLAGIAVAGCMLATIGFFDE